MYALYYECYLLGHERPTKRDVNRYVVPKYAHRWRDIGMYLQFDHAELQIIQNNCLNNSEKCCKDLLIRWLERTTDATWDLLLSVIDNLQSLDGLNSSCPGEIKGYTCMCKN